MAEDFCFESAEHDKKITVKQGKVYIDFLEEPESTHPYNVWGCTANLHVL